MPQTCCFSPRSAWKKSRDAAATRAEPERPSSWKKSRGAAATRAEPDTIFVVEKEPRRRTKHDLCRHVMPRRRRDPPRRITIPQAPTDLHRVVVVDQRWRGSGAWSVAAPGGKQWAVQHFVLWTSSNGTEHLLVSSQKDTFHLVRIDLARGNNFVELVDTKLARAFNAKGTLAHGIARVRDRAVNQMLVRKENTQRRTRTFRGESRRRRGGGRGDRGDAAAVDGGIATTPRRWTGGSRRRRGGGRGDRGDAAAVDAQVETPRGSELWYANGLNVLRLRVEDESGRMLEKAQLVGEMGGRGNWMGILASGNTVVLLDRKYGIVYLGKTSATHGVVTNQSAAAATSDGTR